MAELERRIRTLEIKEEIKDFLHLYCRMADTFNADAQAALFTEDCVVSFVLDADPVHGRETLHGFLVAYFDSAMTGSHYITNVEINLDGDDDATVGTYMYSFQRFKGHPVIADCHRWGRYELRLERGEDGWRISRCRLLSSSEYGGARFREQFDRPWPPRFEGPFALTRPAGAAE